jgi:hypothetical protein
MGNTGWSKRPQTELKLRGTTWPNEKGRHPSRALAGSFVHEVKAVGFYADGNGLYLRVDRSGAKRWILRTVVHGRRRDIGLGGFSSVSLIEARATARVLRRIAREDGDPFEARSRIAWASRPEILQAIEAAIESLQAAGVDPGLLRLPTE